MSQELKESKAPEAMFDTELALDLSPYCRLDAPRKEKIMCVGKCYKPGRNGELPIDLLKTMGYDHTINHPIGEIDYFACPDCKTLNSRYHVKRIADDPEDE
jgi:hypothetical protein